MTSASAPTAPVLLIVEDGVRAAIAAYELRQPPPTRATIKAQSDSEQSECLGDGCCTNPMCETHGLPPTEQSESHAFTEDLVLRLAHLVEDAGGLLSALDYAVRGAPGCMEPDEWQERRRLALAEHGDYLGLGWERTRS
jgi:hypothetical protein